MLELGIFTTWFRFRILIWNLAGKFEYGPLGDPFPFPLDLTITDAKIDKTTDSTTTGLLITDQSITTDLQITEDPKHQPTKTPLSITGGLGPLPPMQETSWAMKSTRVATELCAYPKPICVHAGKINVSSIIILFMKKKFAKAIL